MAGNDITGNVTGTLLRFLEEPSLPTYYKFKAYLALSAADERDEPWENLTACRHYLQQARKALEEAKELYVGEQRDVDCLKQQEQNLREEWDELRERERLADSDDGDSESS